MSAKPPAAAAPAKEPAKRKLVLIGAIVVVLVVVAAAALLFLNGRNQESDEEHGSAAAAAVVPTFLPLDNMVVNLADPGGDRFVQLGITLELADDKTASLVKQYLPSIRSGILMLVSQRSSEELLLREGKEKLAAEIREEVSRPLGLGSAKKGRAQDEDLADEEERPGRQQPQGAVRRVLFSSFIIQ
ncbi:flagellar basal body-associated FliL family protein [Comamonas endophytica]|uniref:flagellar basal body-associated FliL family protein n=1 Tax=Comamonas endophytica TaxID=2949090 RepID=UPI001E63E81E|nr:flagellar basal body-associated FliL family protein [Acidovorax sp. D4N7]